MVSYCGADCARTTKGQRGETIKQAGAVALHTFPKCEKVKHLGGHLDAWEDLKEDFGQE